MKGIKKCKKVRRAMVKKRQRNKEKKSSEKNKISSRN